MLVRHHLIGIRICSLASVRQMPVVDCYTMLGVRRNATLSEIKKAYRAKSLQCHPDSMEGAESMFGPLYCDMVQLNLCYTALMQWRNDYNGDNSWRWLAPPDPAYDDEFVFSNQYEDRIH